MSLPPFSAGPAAPTPENRLYARVRWRLLPVLFSIYTLAYLDRFNVGFAKLRMLSDLGWSETVYGFGAGVFFLGLCLFGTPSSMLLHRVGIRQGISLLMIVWGLVSTVTAWVTNPFIFYILRFLLGVAEGGFYPGMILYLTYWFPLNRRAQVNACFLAALPMSGVFGGPLSGWIMQSFHGFGHFAGWQWLFLLEGIPTVLLGCVVPLLLPNTPQEASWLSEAEKAQLQARLSQDPPVARDLSFRQTFTHPRVWHLGLMGILSAIGMYGIAFWMPQIIHDTGEANLFHLGIFSALPYFVSVLAMVWIASVTDRNGRRRQNYTWCLLAAASGWLLIIFLGGALWPALLGLTISAAGNYGSMSLLASIKSEIFGGKAAAAAFALMNSISALGGFLSPYIVGVLHEKTHSLIPGLWCIFGSLLAAAFLFNIDRLAAPRNPAAHSHS